MTHSIPQNWQKVRLKDVCSKVFVGIASSATHAYRTSGVILFRNQNIKEGYLDDSDILYVDEQYELSHKNKRLAGGDLLIARTGYPGTCCVVPSKYKNAQSFTTLIVRPKQEKVIGEYLCFCINSKGGKSYVELSQIGGAQKNLNARSLDNLPVALPTITEQRRIVIVLQAWEGAIKKLQRRIVLKKKIKEVLTEILLTGKKRLPGFVNTWQSVSLGSLFQERKETDCIDLPLLSITANEGVILQSNSNKKDTSNKDKAKYKRICPDDIGYNTMRMWQGRCALSELEGIVSPAYTIVIPNKNTNSQYFSYLFKTSRLTHLFLQQSQGLVSDTLNCKFKDFAKVRCSIPDFVEQTAIANILEMADKEIAALIKELHLIEKQKDFLLINLVTGRIRTPENMSISKS